MANTLFLRLEGPLQAWGERSRWGERDTLTEPTKSGVVGLLACVLGWREDDPIRILSQHLVMGIRCDRPGIFLKDYHTIEGGVLSAEGKVKRNATTREAETVVSNRTYLADASFLVALQGDDPLIDSMATAVQAPVWVPFLGRKACPPSVPLYEGVGVYTNLITALTEWVSPYEDLNDTPLPAKRRVVWESQSRIGVRYRDEVVSRRWRTFEPRYVQETQITFVATKEEQTL